jgi:ABC-2 type transport system permease protein
MKRILGIGHNDLRLFLSQTSSYVWLLAMPLAFVYFMGFASGGPGAPFNRKPPVLVDNQDTNFLGRIFLNELGAQGIWLLNPTNRETAARVIRIPAEFTRDTLQQRQTKLEFLKRDSSAEADTVLIEVRLVRALIALNGHILEAVSRPEGTNALNEATLHELLLKPDPVTLEARFAGRKPVPSGFNFSLPGNLVMYLMMNLLIFGGASVAAERRAGVLKRITTFPVRPAEIILGKIYGLVMLGAVMIVFFLTTGKYVFRVNLGANLPAVALTLIVFAWVAASLGVLIGFLLTAEDRVIGLCVLLSLLMAALGGCWWPLELAPPTFKNIALCLPTGWALQALHQLISFGSGLEALLGPLAVLLGFGATANMLAARFFRV